MVKNLPAHAGEVRDMGLIPGWRGSPGGGSGSSILAWRIPGTEEPGGLQSIRVAESDTEATEHHALTASHFLINIVFSLSPFMGT